MTNPLVLEFLLGCALGFAFQKGVTLPAWSSVLLIVAGALGLFFAGRFQGVTSFLQQDRVILFGIPAFCIVTGAVFLEKAYSFKIPASLLLIGDSSYSLYLSHQYVLEAAGLFVVPLMVKTRFSRVRTISYTNATGDYWWLLMLLSF